MQNTQSRRIQHPQYGIDAPGLLKFFFVSGVISATLLIAAFSSPFLSGILKQIACLLLAVGAFYLLGMGCFMFFYSKIQKLKDRENLLNLVEWSGDELVLDIGCGRGLMLIGAAKRLKAGRAIGIDLWRQEDQANNSLDATLANAKIEDVLERVEVKTADMRQLPFPENYFDVITSNWTVHNLEAQVDRQKALDEMIRVLKPGGNIILGDITNQSEYISYFRERGMVNVRLHNNPIQDAILKTITFGSFAPSVALASKPNNTHEPNGSEVVG
ncbi:MAG: class I SAM-dependent methyltransferase [Oscillatoriophycideae cyanobacterium NC_groundwater_1537_Pr4_S-0.65um_50_18]|nr:class I SAM-dependent methyltransferase [Oscillatoriophycideae cyanobacterium NC_groundwater_1537_Pr4_S-0.65um_50_18]